MTYMNKIMALITIRFVDDVTSNVDHHFFDENPKIHLAKLLILIAMRK